MREMTRILFTVLVAFALAQSKAQTTVDERRASLIDKSIAYVVEPFGLTDGSWYVSDNLLLTNGTRWDTDIDGSVLDNQNIKLQMYSNGDLPEEERFGSILQTNNTAHTCTGAKKFRFRFQVLTASAETEIKLSLYDDSDCYTEFWEDKAQLPLCQNATNLKQYDILSTVIQTKLDDKSLEPYDIEIPVSDLDPSIDLRRVKGWEISLVHGESVSIDNTDPTLQIILSDISCIGNSDMLSAPFSLGPWFDIENLEERGEQLDVLWRHVPFNSDIADELTVTELRPDGVLAINYTVEQVEPWGGFNDWGYTAPGNGYWNLSGTDVIALDYRIPRQSSLPGRALFRLVLNDRSHCTVPCGAVDQERYYSFNPILNNEVKDTPATIMLPMDGSTNNDASFWLTGWSGVFGNRQLDKEYITGFYLEIVLDSQSEIGTLLDGAIEFSNIGAFGISEDTVLFDFDDSQCTFEDGLFALSTSFERIEFLGKDCCQLCSEKSDCLYAISSGRDCFLAAELTSESVRVQYKRERSEYVYQVYSMEKKRGDFCSVCTCDVEQRLINCASKDMAILPKTFSPAVAFQPVTIDLSQNPRLVFLGDGAFTDLPDSIETIILPSNISVLGENIFDSVPNLRDIGFEGNDSSSLKNAITQPDGAYDDICCTPGESTFGSLRFCGLVEAAPGIDSVYLPFAEFVPGRDTVVLRPSSPFLSEASETLEKCAEYCSITWNCNYFQYDARLSNAVHLCYLIGEVGGPPEERCCENIHYASLDRKDAGWTAGFPPRTRRTEFNSRVVFSTDAIELDSSNGFKAKYSMSLGSNPTRGAVWVEPRVSNGEGLDVEVEPKRLILYDSNSTAEVTVFARGVARNTKAVVVIENLIESCDLAFFEEQGTAVYVEIIRQQNTVAIVLSVVAALSLVMVATAFFYQRQLRKRNDAMWMVRQKELLFSDPPEVIGRGTFGLVLLAEYRGTKVAVKRAIPPRQRRDSISKERSMLFENLVETSDTPNDQDVKSSVGLRSGSGYGSRSNLAPSSTSWNRLKADFMQEMRILAKLRHPCITTVMGGVISKDVEPMLVMEYMEHKSLYELLQNRTFNLDGVILLNILRDISQGLRFLHAADPVIVHGDLKAQNILVDRKFRAKVADFGLSQKQRLGATGTPYWMAPELLRQQCTNSTESDIYSYGMILYEVYARLDPYEGLDPATVLEQIVDPEICLRPEIPSACPDEVRSLLKSCLCDDPSRRPTSGEIDVRLGRAVAEEVAPTIHRRQKSHMSLHDIFPEKVARALEEGRDVEPDHREEVTIFFSDIVGFTNISTEMEPQKVANMLHRLYQKFDELCEVHGCYKLETIGDAYLVVTNLVCDQPDDHAKRVAMFAMDAIKAANSTPVDDENPAKGCVGIRVGFHSGPIVADVVGSRSKKYTLFGDTINTASRMESTSQTNRIQCSETSVNLLRKQAPEIDTRFRGTRSIKGKGFMCTYWVVGEAGGTSDEKHGTMVKARSARRHSAPAEDLNFIQWASKCQEEENEVQTKPNIEGGRAHQHRTSFHSKGNAPKSSTGRRVSFSGDHEDIQTSDIETPSDSPSEVESVMSEIKEENAIYNI